MDYTDLNSKLTRGFLNKYEGGKEVKIELANNSCFTFNPTGVFATRYTKWEVGKIMWYDDVSLKFEQVEGKEKSTQLIFLRHIVRIKVVVEK